MFEIELDTSNLEALLRSLDKISRRRVLNNSFKSIAAKTRKKVQEKVAAAFAARPKAGKPRKKGGKIAWRSVSAPRKDVARGVKSIVLKRGAGFVVSLNGELHITRTSKKGVKKTHKPVLAFNEFGSHKAGVRHTKKGYNRGNLPTKGFMKSAARTIDPQVAEEFKKIILIQTQKLAAKYGVHL